MSRIPFVRNFHVGKCSVQIDEDIRKYKKFIATSISWPSTLYHFSKKYLSFAFYFFRLNHWRAILSAYRRNPLKDKVKFNIRLQCNSSNMNCPICELRSFEIRLFICRWINKLCHEYYLILQSKDKPPLLFRHSVYISQYSYASLHTPNKLTFTRDRHGHFAPILCLPRAINNLHYCRRVDFHLTIIYRDKCGYVCVENANQIQLILYLTFVLPGVQSASHLCISSFM